MSQRKSRYISKGPRKSPFWHYTPRLAFQHVNVPFLDLSLQHKALREQALAASLGLGRDSYPVSELVSETCLSLPIFPELTDGQVDHVIASVNAFRDGGNP